MDSAERMSKMGIAANKYSDHPRIFINKESIFINLNDLKILGEHNEKESLLNP